MQAALNDTNGNGARAVERVERISELEDELAAERHKARATRRAGRARAVSENVRD